MRNRNRPAATGGRWTRGAARIAAAGVGAVAAGYLTSAAITWWRYGRTTIARPEDRDALLDRFMPEYEIVERHHVDVAAPAGITFAAACEQDLQASRMVRALFKARELALGSTRDRRVLPTTLVPSLLALGWGVLAKEEGREIVLGTVTKPWEADVVFKTVTADAFPRFDDADHVKIVVSLRADPVGDRAARFHTETRAIATDAAARAKFRRYWAFVSPGVRLIRRMSLGPLKAKAERRARRAEGLDSRRLTAPVPPEDSRR